MKGALSEAARLRLAAALALALLACAGPRRSPEHEREYFVQWRHDGASERALTDAADQHLREELRRCDGLLVGAPTPRSVTLRPSLEVLPGGLVLRVVGQRDDRLLGTFSAKATGATRQAQVRAVVSRVCDEARNFE